MVDNREKILEVKDLNVTFHARGQEIKAVRGVSLEVCPGEILGIVGESGSGKSVTMKAVLGILPENASIKAESLKLSGTEMTKLSEEEYRKLRGTQMTMIFQDPMTALDPVMTVGKHMEEVLKRNGGLKSKEEIRKKSIEMLDKVGIPDPQSRLKQYPHEFSGGMRQRVVIAIAVACRPKILICDEPTTALDVTIQAQILELMQDLQKKMGMAIIMITHDLGVIASMCDEVIVMYAGSVCERGTADNIFYRPRHEYTRGLLRSIPNIDIDEKERLVPISGTPIDLLCMPSGCAFAPRCERAMKICLEGRAPEVFVGKDHISACWMNVKEGMEKDAIEYDSEGRIVRMNLDGGAGA